MTQGRIYVTYSSVDGAEKDRSFRTLEAAREFAHHWIGAHPEIGSRYAVSPDGIGKIEVVGCTLRDLFPDQAQ